MIHCLLARGGYHFLSTDFPYTSHVRKIRFNKRMCKATLSKTRLIGL